MSTATLPAPGPAGRQDDVDTPPASQTKGAPVTTAGAPRPGSRLQRAKMPRAKDVVRDLAIEVGTCVRPVPLRRIDLATGETTIVDVPCGATLAAVCPTCADKARRLRAVQCRGGWHLEVDPDLTPDPATRPQRDLVTERAEVTGELDAAEQDGDAAWAASCAELAGEIDNDITEAGVRGQVDPPAKPARRTRSTRRRQDAPDLPAKPSNGSTLGRTYTDARTGKVFRPSMFLTITLPSYGRVRDDGTPVNPATYGYGDAARDALHFGKLLDRLVQNLRRVAGYDLQYFAAIEPQRRRAPHAHFAIRGTLPRAVVKQVIAATYHQVWWPDTTTVYYDGTRVPVWSETAGPDNEGGYVDPTTGVELPTWDQALDAIDEDAGPSHVVRCGTRHDVQTFLAGSPQAEKAIGYLVKYLTKSLGDTLDPTDDGANEDGDQGDEDAASAARVTAHRDQLLDALRYEPCAPTCANWLRYGVQPRNPKPGQRPGCCRSKAHKPSHLGYAGRRVLVSRAWTGKSLADHKHDRRAYVLDVLGITSDAAGAAEPVHPIAWEMAKQNDPDVPPLSRRILRSVAHRIQQRTAYRAAAAARDRTPTAVDELSATAPTETAA